MAKNRFRILYLILFIAYIGAVFYLCFGYFEPDMKVPRKLFGIRTDKVVHFLMFFPYVFLAQGAFCRKNPWKCLVFVIITGILTAFSMEMLQSELTTYRSTDPWDLSINLSAITLSSVILSLAMIRKP